MCKFSFVLGSSPRFDFTGQLTRTPSKTSVDIATEDIELPLLVRRAVVADERVV
jgi:hypothetical protein